MFIIFVYDLEKWDYEILRIILFELKTKFLHTFSWVGYVVIRNCLFYIIEENNNSQFN